MKIFKFLAVALVAMLGFTACEKHECDFIEVDHSADLVGTWTYLSANYAEALVIKADGSVVSTGVEDGEYWDGVKGNIKTVNNKMTLTFEDGDNYEGRFEMLCGEAFTIFNEEGDNMTYRYCANDLSDEIVGMWVCNDGPMPGDDDMSIQTFKEDGTTILTGIGNADGALVNQGDITYKVVGDLLINIMPETAETGVSRHFCSRIAYSSNGTTLGDVMTLKTYALIGDDIVESTASWLRVKQSLDLAGQKYDYKNVYVSNVKGEDKDIPFFDTTINFAKLDNSLMNNFLSATLFSVEFPDANTMKYSFLLANNITTYPTSIEVEGNKMTIKMSANNSVYKDVELYAFQDKDNSQLHMYMPTKSFENFLGNMQVNIMVEKGQLDLTNAEAVNAIYNEISNAVETINVSLQMTKAAK